MFRLSQALTGLAAVACLVAIVGLVFNFLPDFIIPSYSVPGGTVLVPRGGGPFRMSDGKVDKLESQLRNRIYLHVRDIDLAHRMLDVQVSYALAPETSSTGAAPSLSLLLFEPTDTGASASTCGNRVPAAVERIRISDASSVFSTSSNASVNGQLPVDGDPARYPSDQYTLSICAGVQIGDQPALLNNVEFLIEAERELQDHDIYIKPTYDGGSQPTELISIVIWRNGIQQWFAYAMALLPLLILAAFSIAVPREHTKIVDVMTGVAATFLTVLPLRQVLIPTEVSNVAGITRVDYILGLDLSLMVVLVLGWLTYRLKKP